ncbi:T9SS type A sorting domain-containing protein [Candidatus Fermentibacteria bacterium]|nr:T9SS type A sorting domain-containing protein [Candidatus Fermentibacteria bacterium]
MSTDGGSVWTEIDTDYYGDGGGMASNPTDSDTYWTVGRALNAGSYVMAASKTTNSGSSWNRYPLATGTGMAYSVDLDPANPDIVYVGGYENSSAAIYKTENGGTSWSKLSASGLSGYVYDIAVDPVETNIIYAATSQGVYRSSDTGASWSEKGSFGGCEAVLIDPEARETIYVGTSNAGCYKSDDSGDTWEEFNDGLSESTVQVLAIDPGDYLFAGTDGGAVYRYGLGVGVESGQTAPVPESSLCAAPNPAVGSTTLRYSLSAATPLTLTIYDLSGRLVATLVDSHLEAGEHSVVWNGTNDAGFDVGPGIYLTRLQTSSEVITGKLVLTR